MVNRSILKFVFRSAIMWIVPMLVLVAIYVVLDPMLVLRWHKDMIPRGFMPNKGNVTLKQFEHYYPEKNYDSFMIGSSITINHLIEDWEKHIPEGSVPFHFDLSMMNLEQMSLAVEHLTKNTEIKNVLIVVPSRFLVWESQTSDYLEKVYFLTPIELLPGTFDKMSIYLKFFKIFYGWNFINNYINGMFLHTRATGVLRKITSDSNKAYNEIKNEEICLSGVEYLDSLNRVFTTMNPEWENGINKLESIYLHPFIDTRTFEILKKIKSELEGHNVNYNIVVVPSRDLKLSLNPLDDRTLIDLFGNRYHNLEYELEKYRLNTNLWDDDVHYRPTFARIIMDRVYNRADSVNP